MKRLSQKEKDFIEALRNFRNAKHNPSFELELFIDQIVAELKDKDTAED